MGAMIFKNRMDGGEMLAKLLTAYQDGKDVIILGLPRGGVVTAYAIAKKLHLPLDITCPRKLRAPYNPELAIGAVTETGSAIFNTSLIAQIGVSESYLKEEVERQTHSAKQRLALFRKNLPPRMLAGKVVIIVDDGLATGATMKAAIESVKQERAAKIVVAVPVSPIDTIHEIKQMADDVVCLATPAYFQAVGQFYQDFEQTEDEEVLALLQQAHGEFGAK